MIVLVGLIFLGLWAAGKAKQTGKNQYVWSLISVGIYLIIYFSLNTLFGLFFDDISKSLYQMVGAVIVVFGTISLPFILAYFITMYLMKGRPDGK